MIKILQQSRRLIALFLWLTVFAVMFSACNDVSPLDPGTNTNNSMNSASNVLAKNNNTSTSSESLSLSAYLDGIQNPTYPQTGTVTLQYDKKAGVYSGGYIYLSNGAFLSIREGAFTPPPDTRIGASVTITMTAEFDSVSNELIYSFSPHGSTFYPYAHLTLIFTDLNLADANSAALYYLDDNGNYIETYPDLLDEYEHLMMMEIPHFSRYAIAHSR